MKTVALLLSLILPLSVHATESLPALNLDKNSVTVSGISSGAFMAVQLGVAYSAKIKGVAAIAGGIYGCSEGKIGRALNTCMNNPALVDSNRYVNLVQSFYQQGFIDDPAYLAQQQIFILNGTEDKTIMPVAGQKLEEFYKSLGTFPRTEFSLNMGHAFPSRTGKIECAKSHTPWMNDCGYDGAKEILETFYGPLQGTPKTSQGQLLTFNQRAFAGLETTMLPYAHIYIPPQCRTSGENCRLHIALHGCTQGPTMVGEGFTVGAGYNEWADLNNIVILYPAVGSSIFNPKGCWDWFGYTGPAFAVKDSVQMTAIMKMVRWLTESQIQ